MSKVDAKYYPQGYRYVDLYAPTEKQRQEDERKRILSLYEPDVSDEGLTESFYALQKKLSQAGGKARRSTRRRRSKKSQRKSAGKKTRRRRSQKSKKSKSKRRRHWPVVFQHQIYR